MAIPLRRASFVLSTLLLAAVPATAQVPDVDLELALLVDVSGSVSSSEYNLQKTGYVQAFQNPALWNAISQGAIGKIAVSYIEWSGYGQQSMRAGWSIIDSEATMNSFAMAIQASSRAFFGNTGVGEALVAGSHAILNNGISSTRQVIDVSGDGCTNSGQEAVSGRSHALAEGVDAINGLVIQPNNSCFASQGGNVLAYYSTQVVTPGGFVEVANDFDDFGAAVDRKIIREVQSSVTPEPVSMLLLGSGLAGLGFARRRRREDRDGDSEVA